MFKSITKKIRTRGFTLIELLVVITIIGILAGIIIISVGDAIDRARLARAKSFARTIQTDLALDAVGIWRFDDDPQAGVTDGVHDASGWGNHGTMLLGANGTGCAEGTWQEGVFGKALCFDGVDDYVDAGNDASLDITDAITIEAWVKTLMDCDARSEVIRRGDFQPYSVYFWSGSSGLLLYQFYDGAVYRGIAYNFAGHSRVWTHIAVAFQPAKDTMQFFLNGELRQTSTVPWNPVSAETGATRMGGNFASHFYGLIDEVRIYNRALEVYEIQDRYVKGIESLLARGIIADEEFQERLAALEQNLVKQ